MSTIEVSEFKPWNNKIFSSDPLVIIDHPEKHNKRQDIFRWSDDNSFPRNFTWRVCEESA